MQIKMKMSSHAVTVYIDLIIASSGFPVLPERNISPVYTYSIVWGIECLSVYMYVHVIQCGVYSVCIHT